MKTATILSQCHLSEVKWIPEPDSRLGRKRANNARHNRQFIKPMTWKPGEKVKLNAWRREMGSSMSSSGYRANNAGGLYR